MIDIGKTAFEAYNANRGGKTHDGKDTPPWEELGEGVQEGWTAAGRAVVVEVTEAFLEDTINLMAEVEEYQQDLRDILDRYRV